MMKFNRREFLKFMGVSAVLPLLANCSGPNADKALLESLAAIDFEEVAATRLDALVLPKGFNYKVLRSWGDELGWQENFESKQEKINFGFNNDFTCFFPLMKSPAEARSIEELIPFSMNNHTSKKYPAPWQGEGLELANSQAEKIALKDIEHGLLWVNHETIDEYYIKDKKQQRKAVGGSIFRVQRNASGEWGYVEDNTFSRRLDADSYMEMTGPAAAYYPAVRGTLANCSGGQTPWMSVLTCEENYHFFDEIFGWENFDSAQYGWVVEIDPYNKKSTPRKHTAMGRFAHENAAVTLAKDGRIVVYMGDDKEGEHVYKFISKKRFNPNDRKANFDLLTEGNLYVAKLDKVPSSTGADSGKGEWVLLSTENPFLKVKFTSQADLLINTRDAAKAVSATALDRPEDIEVSPYDGAIFISLTKNKQTENRFGSILKIREPGNDYSSTRFTYENFLVGGEDAGMACPDNLAFDNRANLWVCSGVYELNDKDYAFQGNNSLYVIPLYGENAGKAKRFASAPLAAEFTGPSFSPDYKTLFLSVQHPGEYGEKSTWPHGGDKRDPQSSVVAIKLA